MSGPVLDERSTAEELARRLAEPEQLWHANRLATVGRLTAGIIHELGTPLNVIGSYAQMIATGEVTGDEALQPARAIEEQVQRMSRIIRQLLDFARRNVERREPVDLLSLARQTATLLNAYAMKAGITLAVDSEAMATLAVMGSAGLLQQVLANLITNAIQAMPGGGQITIRLDAVSKPSPDGGPHQRCIQIAVRDQGAGIPEDIANQIFEPFFTTKARGAGTGLGLSVCADIVREHGGWIELETEADQGSCFCVLLPRMAATAAKP